MKRWIMFAVLGLLVANCARAPESVAVLPGVVTEVEIQIPENQVALVDWTGAAQVAGSDGYFYRPPPQSPQQPTRADIEKEREIDELNDTYARYAAKPETMLRAQKELIPVLEAMLENVPKGPFDSRFYRPVPKLNGPAGIDLKLVLKPTYGVVGPPQRGQNSSYLAEAQRKGSKLTAGDVIFAVTVGAVRSNDAEGTYEIIDLSTNKPVKSGAYKIRIPTTVLNPRLVYAQRFWRYVGRH